jgi:uncharacterized protein (TIGR03067 family)
VEGAHTNANLSAEDTMTHFATALTLFLVATFADDDLAKKDLQALQGTWVMAAMEVEGQKIAEDRLQGTELEIKEGKYVVTANGKRYEMTFTLDAAKKPKEIDMVFTEGPEKDKLHRGIYEIEGDTFKLCRLRDAEYGRPRDFTTSPGTSLFWIQWKRKPK